MGDLDGMAAGYLALTSTVRAHSSGHNINNIALRDVNEGDEVRVIYSRLEAKFDLCDFLLQNTTVFF